MNWILVALGCFVVPWIGLHADSSMDWQGLPEDAGREEVFYTCQACHSLAMVKQQALNRRTWDQLLDWMITEKGMPAPAADARVRILDYLTAHYGPKLEGGTGVGGMPPISVMRP